MYLRGVVKSERNTSHHAHVAMRHYIEKLMHTLALWLYRLPQASQLLHHLGPDWHVLGHGDFHLVVTHPSVEHGRQNQCPTVLEALAARVPSWGPHVDLKVIAPWEVPNCGGACNLYGGRGPIHQKGLD